MFLKSLLRHPSATLAGMFVVFVCLAAILAYWIAPDATSNANRMVIELSAKPIGYSHQLLKVPQKMYSNEPSIIEQTIKGKPKHYNFVPINAHQIKNDTLFVTHYIDETLSEPLSFSFKELGVKNGIEAEKLITKYTYLLGSDRYGRDILSRLLVGSRVSLIVGIVSVLISITIGIILGSLAGWYGGWIDKAIMWLINILWAIPTLLLVFAISLTIGKGFFEIFLAIGLTSWVGSARLIRGQVMQIKELDYITAAKVLGNSNTRIILRHILPNIMGPILVVAAATFASAILTEAGLSFLGLGVQPPTPSWGYMIKEHYNFLVSGTPMPALLPGIAIMLLVLAFNILGNTIRDRLDVRN